FTASIHKASLSIHSLLFFNVASTSEIYTLSLHDALPILGSSAYARPNLAKLQVEQGMIIERRERTVRAAPAEVYRAFSRIGGRKDRKSTRLNSSHDQISYAVFCLKKKKQKL